MSFRPEPTGIIGRRSGETCGPLPIEPAEWSAGHATLSHRSAATDNFIQITPFLYVADLDMALAFFTDILGFEVQFRGWNEFAYVHRETVGFRLWQRPPEDLPQGARRFAHYIDVRDVDAIYAELKPKLDTLPAGDVHGPADKHYGQRELLIVGPDGELIIFGQAIPAQAG